MSRSSSLWNWRHYDAIGNVAATTNASGNMNDFFHFKYDQDSFGNVYGISNPILGYVHGSENGLALHPQNQKGYHQTTKEYDDRANMYFFNFRWYDPIIGRFISQEPLGLDGPNLYHFTFNNPVNSYDPNGLQGVESNPWESRGIHQNSPFNPYSEEQQSGIFANINDAFYRFLLRTFSSDPMALLRAGGYDPNSLYEMFWRNTRETRPFYSGSIGTCGSEGYIGPGGVGINGTTDLLFTATLDVYTGTPLSNYEAGINLSWVGIPLSIGYFPGDPRRGFYRRYAIHLGPSYGIPLIYGKAFFIDASWGGEYRGILTK